MVLLKQEIILLGKTGNGKSSTGNSILGEPLFEDSSHMTTRTTEVDFKSRMRLKVVDTPGVHDWRTQMSTEKGTAQDHKNLSRILMDSPCGYHAVLIVFRYGTRVTKDDAEILTFLKKISGANCVKDHGILVMTNGDDFERDAEESGISFTEWIETQGGYFKEMLDECDRRIVLIDNKTKDDKKKKKQISHLLSMVDGLGGNLNKELTSEEIPDEECGVVDKRTSHDSSHPRKGKGKKTIVCHEWLTVERLPIVFTCISVALVSITLIITGVKLSGEPVEKEHQNVKDSFFDTGPVCVTCSKLVNYQNGFGEKNPMLDQLTKKIKKNVEKCCAEDWERLAVLMTMVVQRARKNRAISPSDEKSLFQFSPVTAHKSLITGDWEKGEASFFDDSKPTRPAKLNQTYNDPLTEHVRGLELAEDGFVIPYSGYYYVYASLLFKPNSTKAPKDFLYTELYGYIYRKSRDLPAHKGYLIKMCHKLCDECRDDEETVFSGGFMKLYAGDIMQVHVTGQGFVEFNGESSYFGLVMLASEEKSDRSVRKSL